MLEAIMNLNGEEDVTDVSDHVPPTYQIYLLIVLVLVFAVCLGFAWIRYLVTFCRGQTQYEYPEFEKQGIMLLITTVLGFFKFVGLISLSFLPESESESNEDSTFSSGWMHTLFTFGEGLLAYVETYSMVVKWAAAVIVVIFESLVLLPSLCCSKCCCISRENVLDFGAFISDLLFENVLEWMSPALTCTDYSPDDAAALSSDPDFVYNLGRDSSCTSRLRLVYFGATLLLLADLFIWTAYLFLDKVKRKNTTFYLDWFVVTQSIIHTVDVGVSVILQSMPLVVYPIVTVTMVILSIHSSVIWKHGCRTIRSSFNIVFYIASAVTGLLSFFMELRPSSATVLSFISFLFVILAFVACALIVLLFLCKRPKPVVPLEASQREQYLFLAVDEGDVTVVEALLDNGTDVDTCHEKDKTTPLYHACKDGNVEMTKTLLKYNATIDVDCVNIAVKNNRMPILKLLFETDPYLSVNEDDRNGDAPLSLAIQERGCCSRSTPVEELLRAHGADESMLLCLASRRGDEKKVKDLLRSGVDVNRGDEEGNTPLHYAADKGHVSVIEILLKHDADIDRTNGEEQTPLMLAVIATKTEAVECLLKHNANTWTQDSDGWTALHHCATSDENIEIAKLLLKHKASQVYYDKNSRHPLDIALSFKSAAIFDLLLEAKAHPNYKDRGGKTPLYRATRAASHRFTHALIEHGADIMEALIRGMTRLHIMAVDGNVERLEKLIKKGNDVNTTQYKEKTPLHFACEAGQDAAAECLLKHGADPNVKDKYDHTPMFYAAENKCLPAVEVLLRHGAEVDNKSLFKAIRDESVDIVQAMLKKVNDLNIKESRVSKHTPLLVAVIQGNLSMVQLLVEHGADVNKGDDSYTPLSAALEDEHNDIASYLQAHGAVGSTPLIDACMGGNEDAVERLLRNGAQVNEAGSTQETPLFVAAQKGYDSIVKLLLKHGAAVNQENMEGKTPLFIAAENGHFSVTDTLLKHGADPNVKLKTKYQKGETALYAVCTGSVPNLPIARLLIERGADVDSVAHDKSLLYMAIENKQVLLAEMLLEAHATVSLGCLDEEKESPLHLAAANGDVPAAQLLLDHGAAVDTPDDDDQTPLERAVVNDHPAMVKLLLKHGASIFESAQSTVGILAMNGDLAMIQDYLRTEGEINDVASNERTFLWYATRQKDTQLMRWLLEHGADVNQDDFHSESPLHVAAYGGDADTCRLLLEYKADVKARDRKKRTPLHRAALSGHPNTVKLLVEAGSDINAEDEDGCTPLILATQGKPNALKMLLDLGADIDKPDGDGQTALAHALKDKHSEAAHVLKSRGAQAPSEEDDKYVDSSSDANSDDIPDNPDEEMDELDKMDFDPDDYDYDLDVSDSSTAKPPKPKTKKEKKKKKSREEDEDELDNIDSDELDQLDVELDEM